MPEHAIHVEDKCRHRERLHGHVVHNLFPGPVTQHASPGFAPVSTAMVRPKDVMPLPMKTFPGSVNSKPQLLDTNKASAGGGGVEVVSRWGSRAGRGSAYVLQETVASVNAGAPLRLFPSEGSAAGIRSHSKR